MAGLVIPYSSLEIANKNNQRQARAVLRAMRLSAGRMGRECSWPNDWPLCVRLCVSFCPAHHVQSGKAAKPSRGELSCPSIMHPLRLVCKHPCFLSQQGQLGHLAGAQTVQMPW